MGYTTLPFTSVKVRATPSTVTVMSVEMVAATFWVMAPASATPVTAAVVRVPLREAVRLV